MARVGGFEISFTHRGSWKADLLAPGKEPDVIPVAWQTDYDFHTKRLLVLCKTAAEADALLARDRFRVALATKNPDGSASAQKISQIFWVTPVGRSDRPRLGVHCIVEGRASPSD
jgi:hypothetical protein